ncbi:MAG: peptide ABC transporter substrate-binding protein [Gammaproteobacteria bacterium]|nr:peptide ABC transporter substrate-binding protein [Gammaproteobacteria bacterium]
MTASSDTTGFNRSAARQLILLGLAALAGLTGLMFVLAWASEMTGSQSVSDGVDPATRSITLALGSEPPQLDSTRATDQVSGQVLGHIMEGLMRYDENNLLAPGMADRWDIQAQTATFWIRSDAYWSDGEPVTAHDFVFAWRKALEPATASQYAFILFPIKNGEAVSTGELPPERLGVVALDDKTLVVQLERPIAYFDKLVAFSTYYPIRQDFFESRDGRYGADAEDLLYNGPFTIARWVHGAQIRLEKNSYYWDAERVQLEVIDWAYITADVNAIINLYKDGRVAGAGLNAETLENALVQRWRIQRFADGSVFFIELNHREDRITRNYHLRKAMRLVTDPSELVYKIIKLPGNLPGVSIFPVWLKGVNGYFRQEYPAPEHRVDVAAAHAHLAIAREELGLSSFPPLIFLTGDNPSSNKQSEYFQNVFKKHLGLDVKIDRQIFKQRLAKMAAGDFDMVLAGWGPDFDDPLTFGDLFSSWNKNNRGMYDNPELDRWVRVAQASLDPRTRMDAFAEIQRIIIDDVVILPNYERGVVFVRDARLKGVVRRTVGPSPDFTNAYIEAR